MNAELSYLIINLFLMDHVYKRPYTTLHLCDTASKLFSVFARVILSAIGESYIGQTRIEGLLYTQGISVVPIYCPKEHRLVCFLVLSSNHL